MERSEIKWMIDLFPANKAPSFLTIDNRSKVEDRDEIRCKRTGWDYIGEGLKKLGSMKVR